MTAEYRPPALLSGGHLLTIYPSLFRKIEDVAYWRQRIDTPDDDFLDLDWATVQSDRLVIISHGLEGNSGRPYVRGMVRAVNRAGADALAWNFRSCGGEMNRQLRFYHSGAWDDLETVILHAVSLKRYKRIDLVGFSMGGNQILLYLALRKSKIPPELLSAMVFSVPVDLAASARQLARPVNKIYMRRFMRHLRGKIRQKAERFPGRLDIEKLNRIRTFLDFDDRYTAPIHGFKDARDYWSRCSSRSQIPKIEHPTCLVNALDDPFLTPSCYPHDQAEKNPNFVLLTPRHGGHVGFVAFNREKLYWSERLAIKLLNLA